MKRVITIIFFGVVSLFFIGCDFQRKINIPGADGSKEIEIKIRELGIQIDKIDETKVLSNLTGEDAASFKRRIRELKINYNRASSLIKENYKKEDEEKIEVEYFNTKVIWDYIVHNYPI